MSKADSPEAGSDRELTERQVADYLHQHRDFLQRHDYLLDEMELRHPDTGVAISLIERQVGVLRDQKNDLKRRLHILTETARSNERLLERIQKLFLNLLDARGSQALIERLQENLQHDFHADAVGVRLILADSATPRVLAPDDQLLQPFKRLLRERQPLCGHISELQREVLFGNDAAEIASAALIPLCEPQGGRCIGMLGIGSVDPQRYHPEMGTAFLSHLGTVVSHLLSRQLEG